MLCRVLDRFLIRQLHMTSCISINRAIDLLYFQARTDGYICHDNRWKFACCYLLLRTLGIILQQELHEETDTWKTDLLTLFVSSEHYICLKFHLRLMLKCKSRQLLHHNEKIMRLENFSSCHTWHLKYYYARSQKDQWVGTSFNPQRSSLLNIQFLSTLKLTTTKPTTHQCLAFLICIVSKTAQILCTLKLIASDKGNANAEYLATLESQAMHRIDQCFFYSVPKVHLDLF